MMQLAYPRDWQDRWVHECRRVTSSKSRGTESRKLYRGELEQIHGAREAADFIAKGKYEEDVDSDGDICYKKVQTVETEGKRFENEAEVKGSCRVDDEKADMILSAMDKWFTDDKGSDKGSAILDGKVRKRPASAMDGGIGSIMGNTEEDSDDGGVVPPPKDKNEECRSSAKQKCSVLGVT